MKIQQKTKSGKKNLLLNFALVQAWKTRFFGEKTFWIV